jgi:hypothetical protein
MISLDFSNFGGRESKTPPKNVAVVFQHSFYGVLSQFSSSGSQYPKTPTPRGVLL